MLRKDVKIGLAIGGVLLAVLVVYLLITSAPPGGAEVTLAPDASPQQPQPAPEGSQARPPAQADAPRVENDPFRTSPNFGQAPATAPTDDRWHRALTTGKVDSDGPPLLMTETPSAGTKAPTGDAPQATPPSASSIVGASPANAAPTTLPSGQPRTHVIQQGENYSTIAQAAYGNSSYYPHLIRANPNIDPKKLRPGMTIVIPDLSHVVARPSDTPQLASDSKPAQTIDEKREYRVQPSDSLYKISLKLYGKAEKVDAIYELNKDQIGPNRSHLKVGTILKLPEPPTNATAAR